MSLFSDFNPLEGKRLSILGPEGNLNEKLRPKDLPDEKVLELYRMMALLRQADKKAASLQLQGRLGTFASSLGQEASVIASSYAMEKDDWIVPAYRQQGVFIVRQLPLLHYFLYYKGHEKGSATPKNSRVLPVAIPVGSQPLHAVGIGMAARLRNEKTCAITYFGDGATSEGETLEAMNFAGVFKANVIFFCENNQWAISVPRNKQTASQTLAEKALAFGFPGIQVDGNDIFAVYAAARAARERAAKGEGPTFIESFTYRLSDHTSADSAKKYRDPKELEKWQPLDPLKRVRIYLEGEGLWDTSKEEDLQNSVYNTVERAVADLEKVPPQTVDEIFDYTYQEPTPALQEQKTYLKQFFG